MCHATKTDSNGFTLIELIAVIAIIGILAAIALPRFLNLSNIAKIHVLDATEGSLFSAAQLAHSEWIAERMPNSITVDGQSIDITNGYPSTQAIADVISTTRFTVVANGTRALFRLDAGDRPNRCRVRYRAAQSNGNGPRIDITSSGC